YLQPRLRPESGAFSFLRSGCQRQYLPTAPSIATTPSAKKAEPKTSRSPAQAEIAQNSDRAASKPRLRVLASIPAPIRKRRRPVCPSSVRELMALNRHSNHVTRGSPATRAAAKRRNLVQG